MTIGERIRTARKARGFSQVALAPMVGLTQNRLSQFETGSLQLEHARIALLRKFCKALAVPSDYLLGLTDEHHFKL